MRGLGGVAKLCDLLTNLHTVIPVSQKLFFMQRCNRNVAASSFHEENKKTEFINRAAVLCLVLLCCD